uniref:Capsid protein alpha n=1 Tax=Wuhan nodavirus TaxID=356127 RepID=Q0QVT6_9VIRU|nr:capsid precursor protein [Wuhan nodavirus]
MAKKQPRKSVRIAPRMRVSTIPASVNTASRLRSVQTKQLNLYSNTDRLYHVTLPANTAKGTVIYDQIITPAIGRRLRQQAALFQKIKNNSLRFEVQTQTPTTNGGGYVVAFLHDPSMDVGQGENALKALTAVQGTQTSKFWQSVNMNVQTTKQQDFTLNGSDVRLFSPGRFVVLTDGAPTEPVSITILFHWTVELSRPALQRPLNQLAQAVLVATELYQEGLYLRYSNWDGTNFSPPKGQNNETALHMENAFAGLPPISSFGTNTLFYQLPYPLRVTGNEVLAQFIGFSVSGGNLRAAPYQLPGTQYALTSTSTTAQSFQFMVQGVRLTPVMPDEFYGTTQGAFLSENIQSVSHNLLPTICRNFQQMKLTGSSTPSDKKQDLQDRLSSMRDRFWDPQNMP